MIKLASYFQGLAVKAGGSKYKKLNNDSQSMDAAMAAVYSDLDNVSHFKKKRKKRMSQSGTKALPLLLTDFD